MRFLRPFWWAEPCPLDGGWTVISLPAGVLELHKNLSAFFYLFYAERFFMFLICYFGAVYQIRYFQMQPNPMQYLHAQEPEQELQITG